MRPPCGKPIIAGTTDNPLFGTACQLQRMEGKRQCHWHWLLGQSPETQRAYALRRIDTKINSGATWVARFKTQIPGKRFCAGCQTIVPLFYCQGSRCKSCASTASHRSMVERVYGLEDGEYEALLELQHGRCYICHRLPGKKRLAVDHDHATGRPRGLLCAGKDRGCNHAILGNIKDLAMAKRIVAYLENPPYDTVSPRIREEVVADLRVAPPGLLDPPF